MAQISERSPLAGDIAKSATKKSWLATVETNRHESGTYESIDVPIRVMEPDTNDLGCPKTVSIVSRVFLDAKDTVGRFDAMKE